jgi:Pentapeptide repeats (8 copies)
VEELLHSLLDQLPERPLKAQGYGPANLVTLLYMLRGDLRGLDLSLLAMRGASLQGAEMQDADLSGATLQSCVLTETFDVISAVSEAQKATLRALGAIEEATSAL